MATRPAGTRSVLAGLGLVLLAGSGGCGRTVTEVQRDYARTLRPAEVQPAPAPVQEGARPREVRVLRARAYADSDYRAQTLRWKERVAAQIERANGVLAHQFGVRLEAISIQAWDRSGRGDELRQDLADLAAADPGLDVDWVMGFVSSLPVFSESHEHLGMAHFFGHHLVLRGMDSLAEAERVDQVFDRLPAKERESLLRERRAHKETAVLLHEWAHTLGAFHERSPQWIMSPAYDSRHSSFSPGSAEVVALGLRHRNDPEGPAPWVRAYREVVERLAATAWDTATREEAVALADRFLGAAPRHSPRGRVPGSPTPGKPGAPPGPTALRGPADASRDSGDHGACRESYRHRARPAETVAACRAASALPGAPPEVHAMLGHALIQREDWRGGLGALARAEEALLALAPNPALWAAIAQMYAGADTCTAAERAAARATGQPAAEQVAADCTLLRRSVALPSGGQAVRVEREHEYVAAVRRAHGAVLREDFRRALELARQLEKDFPAAAGASLVNCLVRSAQKDRSRARAACSAAARIAPDAVEPHYLLGTLAGDEGRWQEARDELRRTIELEAARGAAWALLAKAYQRLGDLRSLEELKTRYQERFGMPLRVHR